MQKEGLNQIKKKPQKTPKQTLSLIVIFTVYRNTLTFISFFLAVSEDKEKEEDHILPEEQTEECNNSPMVTPKPVRVLISGEKGDSSAVKYKITLTPGYV